MDDREKIEQLLASKNKIKSLGELGTFVQGISNSFTEAADLALKSITDCENYRTEIAKLGTQLSALQKESETHKRGLEFEKNRQSIFRKEIEKLQAELSRREQAYQQSIQTLNEKQQTETSYLNEKNSKLVSQLREEIANLQSLNIRKTEEANEDTLRKITDLNVKIQAQSQEILALRSKVDSQTQENNALAARFKAQSSELTALQAKAETQRQEIANLIDSRAKLQQASKKYEELEQLNQRYKAKLTSVCDEFNQKLQQLNENNVRAQNALSEAAQMNEKLRAQLSVMDKQYGEARAVDQKRLERFESALKPLTQELQQVKEENLRLRQQAEVRKDKPRGQPESAIESIRNLREKIDQENQIAEQWKSKLAGKMDFAAESDKEIDPPVGMRLRALPKP